ncbi:MAG: hypothetical protein IH969_07785 [Candidatus Krumholzibacteriota bacterium]|nr:hypothetical protein [Candidatus Krumholzibacteriota bacterium]
MRTPEEKLKMLRAFGYKPDALAHDMRTNKKVHITTWPYIERGKYMVNIVPYQTQGSQAEAVNVNLIAPEDS